MALFSQGGAKPEQVAQDVAHLRSQGLPDNLIVTELGQKGVQPQQVQKALTDLDNNTQGNTQGGNNTMDPQQPQQPQTQQQQFPSFGAPQGGQEVPTGMPPQQAAAMAATQQPPGTGPAPGNSPAGMDATLYERIEEITEGLIDEKWDELIGEVKKIIEWKQHFEEKQTKMESDLSRLKEDFKTLHQGVLGKLEEYDKGIKEVGTELGAVGKVFKDVIPQFVENVKELGHITKGVKGKKE